MLSDIRSTCVIMGLNVHKFIGMEWRNESRKWIFIPDGFNFL